MGLDVCRALVTRLCLSRTHQRLLSKTIWCCEASALAILSHRTSREVRCAARVGTSVWAGERDGSLVSVSR